LPTLAAVSRLARFNFRAMLVYVPDYVNPLYYMGQDATDWNSRRPEITVPQRLLKPIETFCNEIISEELAEFDDPASRIAPNTLVAR